MTDSASQTFPTSLDEFRAALLDYKSISSWAMGGSVAVPLVDYVMRLGPPWPSAAGVPIITSVAELLIMIFVFHFCSRSTSKVSRRMLGLLVLIFIFFGAYLYLNSSFTFSSPVDGAKHIKGFKVRPDVSPLITSEYTPDDALKDAEYRPEEVWTSSSITTMGMNLLFLWLASLASLSAVISSFVLYHRGRAAGKQVSARASPKSKT